jgi:cation transport ATPase
LFSDTSSFRKDGFSFAIKIIISVLIIPSSCALKLSTPMALIIGIGKGGSKGILIRNGESLERICKIDIVVFYKNGILTEGNPTVSEVHWKDGINTK